jgi:hypothetical protein
MMSWAVAAVRGSPSLSIPALAAILAIMARAY